MGGKGKAKIENCVIYPGSFDPITYGHVNIVKRALHIFDRIIVAVAINTTKSGTFSVEERVGMMQEVFKGEPDVEVDSFSGLLVDYVRTRQAQAILRGIRTVTDFDYPGASNANYKIRLEDAANEYCYTFGVALTIPR